MTINKTLEKLGLNVKEIKLYLALLKSGKARPAELAKITKLNRATLYNVGKGLLAKGIIAEDISGKVLSFTPLPPEQLKNILNQSKRELSEKEALLKNAIGELNLLAKDKSYPVPKIRLIEEENLEKYLFDNTEKWQKAIIESDGIWWGYQDQSFAEAYEKWIHYTWTTPAIKKGAYKPQFFSNETSAERKLSSRYPKSMREMKYMADANFTANMWACGDYLVFVVTHQRPFYLIEIKDKMTAHNTREIFKKLWNAV